MITHFSHLRLHTVSIQGVKQFYCDQLHFPITYESEREIRFQPTAYFQLSFVESDEPLSPVHFAFEVPYSAFDSIVSLVKRAGIQLLKWPDGRSITDFEDGKSVYFRDGDGHLLEIIAHNYVKEGVLPPSGELRILYLREIGFPVNSVTDFRQMLVQLLNFDLASVSEVFTFGIGGTAHAVIVSKQRKWIPIAMTALPPKITVCLGVSSPAFMDSVRSKLDSLGLHYETGVGGGLAFSIHGYRLELELTDFSEETLAALNLPFGALGD